MKLSVFRSKLRELHEKSGMDAFLDWPFVYDADECGNIFVDENGCFYFSDAHEEWIESYLNLANVSNIKFARAFEEPGIDNEDDEPSESYIYISFSAGDSIELVNRHDTYSVAVTIRMVSSDGNKEQISELQNKCDSKFDFRVE